MKNPVYAAPENSLEQEIARNVATAIAEDVGGGDLTAQLVPAGLSATASVISREDAVLCGTQWFEQCFKTLDPRIEINWKVTDGEHVVPNQLICEINGQARALLTGERTALNFLGYPDDRVDGT